MPHAIPHSPAVNSCSNQVRSVEVSQVVETATRQAQPREPRQVVTVADVGVVEWTTELADEEEAAVAILRT